MNFLAGCWIFYCIIEIKTQIQDRMQASALGYFEGIDNKKKKEGWVFMVVRGGGVEPTVETKKVVPFSMAGAKSTPA